MTKRELKPNMKFLVGEILTEEWLKLSKKTLKKTKTINNLSPYHKHDCIKCVYLGSKDYTKDPRNDREYGKTDLYCCEDEGEPGYITVIARYGIDDDYSSGLIFAHPKANFALFDAKEEAINRGIIDRSKVDPWIEGKHI